MAPPGTGCSPIREIPPDHFTYGRSDSDDPSRMDPNTGHVRNSQHLRQGLQPLKVPSAEPLSTSAWRDFPIIASKRGRSSTVGSENTAKDPIQGEARPQRKRRTTEKGEQNKAELEARKRRSADKQATKRNKANHTKEKLDRAKAIVSAHMGKPPEAKLPSSRETAASRPLPQNLHVQASRMGKLSDRVFGSSSGADVGDTSECASESDRAEQDEDASSAETDTSIEALAAEDAVRIAKRTTSRRSEMTNDLLGVFSGAHMARNPKNNIVASCRTCQVCEKKKSRHPQQYRRLQTLFFGSTRSLRMHISRCPDHYRVYLEHCKGKGIKPDNSAIPSDARLRKETMFNKEEESQALITDYGVPIAQDEVWTQEGANDRLLRFVIETEQSIRIVEHPAFRDMMMYQALHGRHATPRDIVGRTKLTSEIEAASKTAGDEIAHKFKAAPGSVSVTFDAWTSVSLAAYQAITGHFINDDWHVVSQLLSLNELQGRHTGENMALDLLDTIAKYIGVDKLGHATADNAANNDKALTELEGMLCAVGRYDWKPSDRRMRCMSHIVNLAQAAFLSALDAGTASASESDDDTEDNILAMLTTDVPDATSSEAHHFTFPPGVVILKVRAFISKLRSTGLAKKFLRDCCEAVGCRKLELVTFVRTRFGSMRAVLHRFIELRPAITRFIKYADIEETVPDVKGRSPKYAAYAFTDGDWDALALILDVLNEAALVQDQFASETEPTVCRLISSFDFFCSRWEEFAKASKFAPIRGAIECGVDVLVKYYCLSDRSTASIICLVLDPAIKNEYLNNEWDKSAFKEAMLRFEGVFDKYATKYRASIAPKAQPDSPVLPPANRFTSSLGGYGDSFRQRAVQNRRYREQGVTVSPREELDRYLTAPLYTPSNGVKYNPLDWWREHHRDYPILAMVARDYFAIQGSAISSERRFSSAGLTDTARRSRLTTSHFAAIQVLKNHFQLARHESLQKAAMRDEGVRQIWLEMEATLLAERRAAAGF